MPWPCIPKVFKITIADQNWRKKKKLKVKFRKEAGAVVKIIIAPRAVLSCMPKSHTQKRRKHNASPSTNSREI